MQPKINQSIINLKKKNTHSLAYNSIGQKSSAGCLGSLPTTSHSRCRLSWAPICRHWDKSPSGSFGVFQNSVACGCRTDFFPGLFASPGRLSATRSQSHPLVQPLQSYKWHTGSISCYELPCMTLCHQPEKTLCF